MRRGGIRVRQVEIPRAEPALRPRSAGTDDACSAGGHPELSPGVCSGMGGLAQGADRAGPGQCVRRVLDAPAHRPSTARRAARCRRPRRLWPVAELLARGVPPGPAGRRRAGGDSLRLRLERLHVAVHRAAIPRLAHRPGRTARASGRVRRRLRAGVRRRADRHRPDGAPPPDRRPVGHTRCSALPAPPVPSPAALTTQRDADAP